MKTDKQFVLKVVTVVYLSAGRSQPSVLLHLWLVEIELRRFQTSARVLLTNKKPNTWYVFVLSDNFLFSAKRPEASTVAPRSGHSGTRRESAVSALKGAAGVPQSQSASNLNATVGSATSRSVVNKGSDPSLNSTLPARGSKTKTSQPHVAPKRFEIFNQLPDFISFTLLHFSAREPIPARSRVLPNPAGGTSTSQSNPSSSRTSAIPKPSSGIPAPKSSARGRR